MKNIIIAGASRTGKSTLAKKINEKTGAFVISLDKLVSVFDGAYHDLDIRLNWDREKTTDNLAPFIGHFLGTFSAVKGNRFVLEGGYFNFDKITLILKTYGIEEIKDSFILIGLAQNKKTVEDFINDFKKYDTEDDWTYGFGDGELREIGEDLIEFNRSMSVHLTKHGFAVYDTSRGREEVLNKIAESVSQHST